MKQHLISRKHLTFFLFIMSGFLLSGCNLEDFSGDNGESIASAQRQTASPKAVNFLIRAQNAFNKKAFKQALILADSTDKYAPELADAYFLRGLVFTEMRRYQEAETVYQHVLSIDPAYEGVYMNLGNTAFRQGDQERALQLYEKEFKINPSAEVLHQIGWYYGKISKPDSALSAYQRALTMDSTHTKTLMRLAEIYKEDGELERSLEYTRKGIELAPTNINYRYFLGSLLLLKGEIPEAINTLGRVVYDRPWHYWANYNLGQALIRNGEAEKGQVYLTRAEKLQEELKNIQDWENLAENNPDQLGLWVNLGEAYRRAGRNQEAIEAFNIALEIEPRFIALQNNLANLYLIEKDTSAAVFHYESIIKRFPAFSTGWLNLGVVYASSGKIDDARRAWQKAHMYAPEDTTAASYLKILDQQSK